MAIKKLIIPNPEAITPTVSSMANIESCSPLKKIGNQHRLEFTTSEGNVAYIDFFFNKGGDVTIQPDIGPNPEISKLVTQQIIEQLCCSADSLKKTASLSQFKKEDFETLVNFLAEEFKLAVSRKALPLHDSVSFSCDSQGRVTLNYYPSTKKLVVQGSACSLKFHINNAIAEICPDNSDELISWMTDAYDVKISIDQVEAELKSLLPNSFDGLKGKIIEILKPGIVYLRMSLPDGVKDYSSFAYPGLRALEGVLKGAFLKQNPLTNFQDEPLSSRFENKGGRDILNSTYGPAFADASLVTDINNGYSFYKRNRHSLFHADGTIESSRIIETKEIADELFRDCLGYIDNIFKGVRKKFG